MNYLDKVIEELKSRADSHDLFKKHLYNIIDNKFTDLKENLKNAKESYFIDKYAEQLNLLKEIVTDISQI